MKKIFWTSIFWIAVVVLFGVYLFVYQPASPRVVVISGHQSQLSDELAAISAKIDLAGSKIAQSVAPQVLSSSSPILVKLYYFNEQEDKLLPPEKQASPQSLSPVFRTLPSSDNILKDTISLLLQWALTENEFKDGFTSSFVKVVRLVDSQLDMDGNLSLSFESSPWSSIWWSAFVAILTNSIIKTALQFPQVKNVLLLPEELFQP